MRNFKTLEIWKASIILTKNTYALIQGLPIEEKYDLSSQMRRAVVSIPSNIAEGCSRKSNRDFKRFLAIALGSSFELETHFLIAKEIGYFEEVEINGLLTQLDSLKKMMYKFMVNIP